MGGVRLHIAQQEDYGSLMDGQRQWHIRRILTAADHL